MCKSHDQPSCEWCRCASRVYHSGRGTFRRTYTQTDAGLQLLKIKEGRDLIHVETICVQKFIRTYI